MANWLTQAGHFMELITPLSPGELAPIDFSGVEQISGLFHFDISMMSGDTAIDAKKLIGKPMSIQIKTKTSSLEPPRYFHGIVTRFHAGSINNGMRYYYAKLNPWLNLLSYTTDCRIFHYQSVVDIAKTIFQEYGFHHYEVSELKKTYQPRPYCVQYRESALNFLQRLFQEEGIFYYFKHAEDKHTLILADSNKAFKPLTDEVVLDNGSGKEHGIHTWQRGQSFYAGKHEQTDYNFEEPDKSLHTEQPGTAVLPLAQKYGRYNYPGRYQSAELGKTFTQHHFEAHEMEHDLIGGSSNYSDFLPGKKFTLSNAVVESDEDSYVLLEVAHFASDSSYLSGSGSGSQSYANQFVCMPSKVPYRHQTNAIKPAIHSIQTATVVGPKGEEIYTDKFGRVKVQFHWDRKGKKDEFSSCWVRVAQSWAGKNWGTLFMPRIGQEVIVQFLEGDPDRPIITGSVYNADNLPPYQLPFEQSRSGIKGHSTKGGGAEANELRFEDKLGQEEVYIHAQKDLTRVVQNNETITVVKGNQATQVQAGSSTLEAAKSIELKVGGNSLVINTSGIFINGALVKINKA